MSVLWVACCTTRAGLRAVVYSVSWAGRAYSRLGMAHFTLGQYEEGR